MISIKITNASELVASKVGKFIERFTPDEIDETLVEEIVMKQMIQTLSDEGLKGEISLVKGIEIDNQNLVLNSNFSIDEHSVF